MIIIGVDPGATGAVVAISDNKAVRFVADNNIENMTPVNEFMSDLMCESETYPLAYLK